MKLICAFVFASADCWFSHAAAHVFVFCFTINIDLFELVNFCVVNP